MDIRKLQRAIVDGLEDVKAQDILVFNTEHLSALFERVIIASGTSNRQTKALASSVRETVKGRGMQVMRTEGEDNGEWIIVDCGAAVVHVMQPAIRQYYHLEEIWGGKPVKLKSAAKEGGLVKASEPEDEEEDAAPGRKRAAVAPKKAKAQKPAAAPAPAAKKAATRTSGGKTAAAKPAAKTASKAAAKPAVKVASKTASKSAAAKPAVKRTTGTRSTKAEAVQTIKVGSKKPVAKKGAATKPAARPAAKRSAPAAKPAAKTAARATRKA
ncbi:ribosome silencing factor [Roseateles sp. BYS180W]|uniref:Ribosomal silencing factor RsfS n=1 Tax=Roseateles rivi TaxID=3299028 RepID=A0ABW7FUV8_9BURK